MSTSLENLLNKRKSKSGREVDCVINFVEKRKRAMRLVEYAHKSKDRKIIAEANNHFVIAVVTAFEVYMTDLLNELITRKKLNPISLLKIGSKREYSPKEVFFIIRNKITVGELLCNSMNFDNIHDLESLLSNLFSIKFFSFLAKHKFKYLTTRNTYNTITFERDYYRKLNKIFEDRHAMVHDLTFKTTPTIAQIKNMDYVMIKLAYAIEILANKFRDNRTSEILTK